MRPFPTKLFAIVAAALTLSSCTKDRVRLHTVGDSTMSDFAELTTQKRGWGEMIGAFVPEGVDVINHGSAGQSSRSFYVGGYWEKALKEIRKGDYVLIQFAHIDEKGKGIDTENGRGTAPWGSYTEYLRKYVNETRAKGAFPILAQGIVRRYFIDNCITPQGCHNLSSEPCDTTLSYWHAMASVARQEGVPIIDICTKSKQIVEAYGPRESKTQLYVQSDNTHTAAKGAALYALAIAEALDTMGIWSGSLRRPAIVTNPKTFDFGDTHVGDSVRMCFDAVYLDGVTTTQPKFLTNRAYISVKAPKGFKLSRAVDSVVKDTLLLDTDRRSNFIVHYAPTTATVTKGEIELAVGDKKEYISISGTGREVTKKEDVSISWTDLNQIPDNGNLTVRVSTLKGVERKDNFFHTADGTWRAEIDESSERYVQLRLNSYDKHVRLESISILASGNICYRIAAALGHDFFQRRYIGERNVAISNKDTLTRECYTTPVTMEPNQMVLLRIFPWAVDNWENEAFEIQDIEIKATACE